jgi:hypothetical protein
MRKLILLTEHEKRDRFCQEIYNVKRDLEQGGNMRENQNKIYQNMMETGKRLEDYIKGIIEYIFDNINEEQKNLTTNEFKKLCWECPFVIDNSEEYLAHRTLAEIKYAEECNISPLYTKIKDEVDREIISFITKNGLSSLSLIELKSIALVGAKQYILDIYNENLKENKNEIDLKIIKEVYDFM